MVGKEAYNLFTDKHSNLDVLTGYEFDSVFVFNAKPKNVTLKENDTIFDYSFSVDKKTGEIKAFQPFFIPIEEYRNGKEIKDFK